MQGSDPATIESRLAEAVARFHREQQGHAPERCEVSVLPDMVIVRCRAVFTPTERELVGSHEGRKLVQSARREQRALTRRDVESRVRGIVGREVLRSYYDLDVRAAEQIEVYVFA